MALVGEEMESANVALREPTLFWPSYWWEPLAYLTVSLE